MYVMYSIFETACLAVAGFRTQYESSKQNVEKGVQTKYGGVLEMHITRK